MKKCPCCGAEAKMACSGVVRCQNPECGIGAWSLRAWECRVAEPVATRRDRELARALYASEDVEIEEDAEVSVADDGVWVQAWVWVPKEVPA